jgi:protein-S-isoprenylcysteine O-methyltransferase Ste14
VASVTRLQIVPEERILLRLFGQTYADYCRQVRRWL